MSSNYANLHPVNEILTSLAIESAQDERNLIADQVLMPIPLPQRSATLLVENDRNFMGDVSANALRASGAPRQSIAGFDRTSQVIIAQNYGLKDSASFQDLEDSQFPGSEEARLARKVARAVRIAKEIRVATLLFAPASGWNNTAIGGGFKWDAATGIPLTDLQNEVDRIFTASNNFPDTLVLGYGAFRAICRSAEVRGYIGTAAAGLASGNNILTSGAAIQVLQDVVGVPNIYVAPARFESADPGLASNRQFVWNTETCFLGILQGAQPLTGQTSVKMGPVAAADFQLTGIQAGQYDDVERINRFVWAEEQCSEVAIDVNFGGILTDCLT